VKGGGKQRCQEDRGHRGGKMAPFHQKRCTRGVLRASPLCWQQGARGFFNADVSQALNNLHMFGACYAMTRSLELRQARAAVSPPSFR
jgi:hypothetical protein